MTTTFHDDQTRQMFLRVDRIDTAERAVSAVVATEGLVDVYDNRSGRIITEVLLISGARFADQVPMFIDHKQSVISTVGSVSGFQRAGGELKAILHFASGTAASDEAWPLVQQKHLRDVSVGYRYEKYRDIAPGRSAEIAGRSFTAPANRALRVVSKWQIKEVSLVPIGADHNAGIRSANYQNQESRGNCTMLDILGGEVGQMTIAKYLKTCARARGRELDRSGDDGDTFRAALSSVDGLADMSNLVNQSILTGFRGENDTTAGWVQTVDLPNFLAAAIAGVDAAPRLEKIGRGGVAPIVGFGVTQQGWRLARFGAQFRMDEEDILDANPINGYLIALAEIGRAARRLIPDLVYSMLLTNAALNDAVPIFDASRNNCTATALSQARLDDSLAAVANQTAEDAMGDPVHLGHAARYLTVPPQLLGTGKRLARDMQTGENDIVVRAESRLGAAGVLNPVSDEIIGGTPTNWMLSSPADQVAGVVVGALQGQLEPTVRHFFLDQGEFGLGFDVVLDLAATVVGPTSLYWSAGTIS